MEKGDRVRIVQTNTPCVIISGPRPRQGNNWFQVQINQATRWVNENDLAAVAGDFSAESRFRQGLMGTIRDFRLAITKAKLVHQLNDVMYSWNATRNVKVLPYQFKPLLQFLSSPNRRILIADEVGLGKTIEAGYILQETHARMPLRNALIVCPAPLRRKWESELAGKFGINFELWDRKRFLKFADTPIPTEPQFGIVSISSIRAQQVLEEFDRIESNDGLPSIDMLIVDEAHHFRNQSTIGYPIIERICDVAKQVVFLSATPIQTKTENLFNLLQLLSPTDFPSADIFEGQIGDNSHLLRAESALMSNSSGSEVLEHLNRFLLTTSGSWAANTRVIQQVRRELAQEGLSSKTRVEIRDSIGQFNLLGKTITRTRKKHVLDEGQTRRAYSPEVDLGPEGLGLYQELWNALFDSYSQYHGEQTARFVIINLSKRMCSSLVAFAEWVLASESQEDATSTEDGDESNQEQTEDITLFREIMRSGTLAEIVREYDIEQLRRDDPKFTALLDALLHRPKVICFSGTLRTLDYIESRLQESGVQYVRIDGSVPYSLFDIEKDERQKRLNAFKENKDIQVLLSSEVGAEGLDMQFCDAVVNWDLPWNPMVLEQRIGRIDRIGQASDVIHIINLACKDTVETDVWLRLYDRIELFKNSIGDLEPILDSLPSDIEAMLFDSSLTSEERQKQIDQRQLAMESQRIALNALEENNDLLLSQHKEMLQMVDDINRLGKFISKSELKQYFVDSMHRHFPNCVVSSEDSLKHEVGLKADAKFINSFEQSFSTTDRSGYRLLQKMKSGKMLISFDPQGGSFSDSEYVNSQHLIMKSLLRQESAVECVPVDVAVDFGLLKQGEYPFAVWVTKIKASQTRCFIEGAVLDPESTDCKSILSADDFQELIRRIQEKGIPPDEPQAIDYLRLDQWFERLTEALISHQEETSELTLEKGHLEYNLHKAQIKKDISNRRESLNEKLASVYKFENRSVQQRQRTRYLNELNQVDQDLEQRIEKLFDPNNSTVSNEFAIVGIIRVPAKVVP